MRRDTFRRPSRVHLLFATALLFTLEGEAVFASSSPHLVWAEPQLGSQATPDSAESEVSGEPPSDDPIPDTDVDVRTVGNDRIHPDLYNVTVVSPELEAAWNEADLVASQIEQTRVTYAGSVAAIEELSALESQLTAQLTSAVLRVDTAERDLAVARERLETLAAALYVNGGDLSSVEELDWQAIAAQRSEEQLLESVAEARIAAIGHAIDARDRATQEAATANQLLEAARGGRTEAEIARETSLHAGFRLADQLAEIHAELPELRLMAPVADLDFPLVALDAFYSAAAEGRRTTPSCGIRWEVLASISYTEGRHGTWLGSSLDPTGLASPSIIGIALDGENGTAVVPDSDGGALDGDASQDRAVGPMQFVPTSWSIWGADGNGDGLADPNNLYDATAAAVLLLCRGSTNLSSPAGLLHGLLLYNLSNDYGSVVAERTRAYEEVDLELE